MHTVVLLDQALQIARDLGYGIRQEWLESGTCRCEFHGRRWIFLDLAEDRVSQFRAVSEILAADPDFRAAGEDEHTAWQRWSQSRAA